MMFGNFTELPDGSFWKVDSMTSPRPTDASQPKTLREILIENYDNESLASATRAHDALMIWAREYGEQCRTRHARLCHQRAMLVLQMDQRAADEARNCAHVIEQAPLPEPR